MRPWFLSRSVWLLAIVLVNAGADNVHAGVSDANPATALRARYATLRDQLTNSAFQRPLSLDSSQTSRELKGDIDALVDYPFDTVQRALKGSPRWCDILILHLNVKYCRASARESGNSLAVYIGRKFYESLGTAHRVEFAYREPAETHDYLQVLLKAEIGPFGTRDYRILLEATPAEAGRTYLHLSYSYTYSAAARLALQTYLGTSAANKVGFTVLGRRPDGEPIYVGALRGAVERNAMRYYLAIDAYLGALSIPPEEQLEKRMRDWFAATERYALQLHEVDEQQYLDMKRRECQRQQNQRHQNEG